MNYKKRLLRAQSELDKWQVDALYVTSVVDIAYFTGFKLSKGVLILFKTKAILLVDGRYFQDCKERAPCEVSLISKDLLKSLVSKIRLGFDQEQESYKSFLNLQTLGAELAPLNSPCLWLR